jgi:hypothetical protein
MVDVGGQQEVGPTNYVSAEERPHMVQQGTGPVLTQNEQKLTN